MLKSQGLIKSFHIQANKVLTRTSYSQKEENNVTKRKLLSFGELDNNNNNKIKVLGSSTDLYVCLHEQIRKCLEGQILEPN